MDMYWWLVLVTFYIIPAITMFVYSYRWLSRRIKRKQQIVVSDIFDFLFLCCLVPLLPIINMKAITDWSMDWFHNFEDKVIFKWDNK
jgi:hypothetical protein